MKFPTNGAVSTHPKHVQHAEKTKHIVQALDSIRLRSDTLDNKFHLQGCAEFFAQKIQKVLDEEQELRFVFPGFPFKSPHLGKVHGSHADMAETVACKVLSQFLRRIRDCTAIRAHVTVISDADTLNQIIEIPDEFLQEYATDIRKKMQQTGMQNLQLTDPHTLLDVSREMGQRTLHGSIKEEAEKLQSDIRNDDKLLQTKLGITRFLLEDLPHTGSKNQRQLLAKKKAVEVMASNKILARIIEEQFPNAIRLSVHHHTNRVDRLGIALSECQHTFATPWHNCSIILPNGKFGLIKKETALHMQCRLITTPSGELVFVHPEVLHIPEFHA